MSARAAGSPAPHGAAGPAPEGAGGPAPRIAETHTSVLLFLGERVYKLRKALDLGFLDFRTRQARAAVCAEEVRLNRRLAEDVYLGVAEVRDPQGAPCDHLVVMRRLPESRRLATLVREGRDVGAELRAVARLLAAFHDRCDRSEQITAWGGRDAVRDLWLQGLSGLRSAAAGLVPQAELAETEALALRYLDGREALFAERQAAGRVVDGHGDLLADDIFCLPDGPRILDCLEFDPRLRAGDVLADVAFLAMDLERLGAPAAARTFLDDYREFTAESHPASLEDFYVAYRAHVRAKVGFLRAAQGEPAAAEQARALSRLCLAHLRRAEVRLVLVGGLPGSGKTTLAEELARATGWVHLNSDAVRKQLHGLDVNAPAGAGYRAGIYTAAATERTYTELLRRAGTALGRGESVVLDATWAAAAHRERARRLAEATASAVVELRCEVAEPVAAARLAGRAAGGSASDADAGIRARLAAAADPWPQAGAVDTALDPRRAAGIALAAAGWPQEPPG